MSKSILNTSVYPSAENASGGGGMQQTPLKPAKTGVKDRLKRLKFKQKYLAFPYGLLVAVFVVVPLIVMLIAAFKGEDGGFTFGNFSKFFVEGDATSSLWGRIFDTFLLALLTTVVSLVISYPLALALCTLKINKRAILIMLFVAPMWINSLLRLYAIKLLFGGMSNKFLLMLFGMVYDFFPFMLLPIYTSLANADKSYFEAASDLGASPLVSLVKVKLPLSLPGIISGIIMVFMPAMSTFAANTVLAGGKFNMFGNMIADMISNGSNEAGSAYSLVLLMIMAIVFFAANRFTKISSRGEGVL